MLAYLYKNSACPCSLCFPLGPEGQHTGARWCPLAGNFVNTSGHSDVEHFLSWGQRWCEGATSSSPPCPQEGQVLTRAQRPLLGTCVTMNCSLVWNSFPPPQMSEMKNLYMFMDIFKSSLLEFGFSRKVNILTWAWGSFFYRLFMWVFREAFSFKFHIKS